MPYKSPKTQYQWAGFQVRECNDYNQISGTCQHEETPIREKGGLYGHDFPNNICKYFHEGRDGACPRTFKQNIAAGLTNMDAVAEEILRQADRDVCSGSRYNSAAIREVRVIWQTFGVSPGESSAGILRRIPPHRIATLTPKTDYATLLWLRLLEKKLADEQCYTRTLVHIPKKLSGFPMHQVKPAPSIPRPHEKKFSQASYADDHESFLAASHKYEGSPRAFARKKTHQSWAGFQVRECDNYDPLSGICMHEETSCHHRGGLHGKSFPNNVCKYFHHGRDGAFPRTVEQNLAAGLVNIEAITDELYRQAYSSIFSNQSYDGAAIRQCRSVMNVVQQSSQRVADADLKNISDDLQSTGDVRSKYIQKESDFVAVHMPTIEKKQSRGFIADVHILKPASICHAAGYWAQLWLHECNRYEPRSDFCAYEKLKYQNSFPENVCLHFHPGRNSVTLRVKFLAAERPFSRELVARALVADAMAHPKRHQGTSSPTPQYIIDHAISESTEIKNELPVDFSVKSVDLPYKWHNQRMNKENNAAGCLPEICLSLHALALCEANIAMVLGIFGFSVTHCEKRIVASGETQYFLWTRTKNGHLLKGIDSLFTVAKGPYHGMSIGDLTLCPADASIQLGARLRFLLLEEVADYRVHLNIPHGDGLYDMLDDIDFPSTWNFRSLLDAHKGVYRHNLTRLTLADTPTLIRMHSHSLNLTNADCAEYVLYDRPLAPHELNLTNKALLLYTPSTFARDAIEFLFKGVPSARVLDNDRLRSLNLSLLAFYMRTLKYIAHRRADAISEIQVVLVGGRTVEKSIEINGIYKIFGANITRPLHRVVTIRLKNQNTPDGFPRYTIGGATVSLADVKKALQSGYIGEIMDMVCITGPTLIDACVADLPTIFTLQEQTHLLEDPSRFIVLMSSEESWMSDLAIIRDLRSGSLQNMLVLVRARDSQHQFQTLFSNQNIILFDRADTSHARHYLRLFILSGIARHLTDVLQHLHQTNR